MNQQEPVVKTFRIGIVAGEASGDLLAFHLIQALRANHPQYQFEWVGMAGPKMLSLPHVTSLFPMEKLSVRGYVEVLKHYREIIQIRKKLLKYFLSNPPDLFIGVDAPDFNLDLEIALKEAGIPVLHYVSPSIWAWRKERIQKIKKAVSHILALFPCEPALYAEHHVPVTYVGHPLADVFPLEPDKIKARKELGFREQDLLVGLLPGSRDSELKSLAPLLVRTAEKILQTYPHAQFLVPLINQAAARFFGNCPEKLPIHFIEGKSHTIMTAVDVAVIASGTATLEAALLKCPMVITYKMPAISWWIIKKKAYLPYVGLPNILAQSFIVPELLQNQATPENLANAVIDWIESPEKQQAVKEKFHALHCLLKQNTSEKVAQTTLALLISFTDGKNTKEQVF